MTDKLTKVEDFAGLSEAALAKATARAAADLPPRQEKMAFELAAGVRPPEAARRAGLSDQGGAPYNVARNEGVQRLVRLLVEAARRKAVVTASSQITRVQSLAVKAEEKGDLATALASEKEVSKLAGVYPETGTGEGTEQHGITMIFSSPSSPPLCLGMSEAEKSRTLARWHERRARQLETGGRASEPCELEPAEPAADAVVDVSPAARQELDLADLLA